MDEPTNHLDQETKGLFQQALLEYGGTVILVSHDRAFLDNLVERVLEIRDGTLFSYSGNYSEFIERRKKQSEIKIERAEERREKSVSDKTREQKRLEAEERNRLYQERKKFMKKLKPLENMIEKEEERKKKISEMLCDAEVLADSDKVQKLMIELGQIEDSLEKNYNEWESLVLENERI